MFTNIYLTQSSHVSISIVIENRALYEGTVCYSLLDVLVYFLKSFASSRIANSLMISSLPPPVQDQHRSWQEKQAISHSVAQGFTNLPTVITLTSLEIASILFKRQLSV